MKPTYNEIIKINPRLKTQTKEDVEKMLTLITSKGYFWDSEKKYFYHEKLGMRINTQGLDLFDTERFEKTFKIWSDPDAARWAEVAQTRIPKFVIIFIIDLAVGWYFLSTILWIASLIGILFWVSIIRSMAKDAIEDAAKEK